MNEIKWIFLDLDDTLWDFAKNSDIALELLYNKESELQAFFESENAFTVSYHALNSQLWSRYHHAEISRDYLLNERFRGVLADALSSVKTTFLQESGLKPYADKLNSEYLRLLGEQTNVVDGARDVLSELSKQYLIGVLSNGFKEVQYEKLRNTGLDRYVQRMVLSDEIGIQKPDRRIYDYALEETGAIANQTVMVGDNPETDVQGALNAGWRAIFFDKRQVGGCPKGALRLEKLLDLPQKIKNLEE